jgi:hypothetical protein
MICIVNLFLFSKSAYMVEPLQQIKDKFIFCSYKILRSHKISRIDCQGKKNLIGRKLDIEHLGLTE